MEGTCRPAYQIQKETHQYKQSTPSTLLTTSPSQTRSKLYLILSISIFVKFDVSAYP